MITITEQIGQPMSYNDDISCFQIDPESIMVDIEGLHAISTGNHTRYTANSLENSVPSWTYPYHRPVIMHHNEKNGKIIGRIISVEYKTSGTRSGTPALVFTVNVPDSEGKQQIKDGRLLTVSVGINATDCRCSICGKNIAEYGPCGHERGHEYSGEICYWDIHEFTGKELSYVITPSDPYTHNLRIYSPTTDNIRTIKEQLNMNLNESLETTAAEQIIEDVNTQPADSNNVNDTTPQSEPIQESQAETTQTTEETVTDEPTPSEEPVDVADSGTPVTESSDDLLNRVVSLSEQLAVRNEELRIERGLRESLENSLAEVRSQYKIMLATSVNTLREKLGKSLIESEELIKRSEDSLKDSISDYTGELALQESATQQPETTPVESTVAITEGLKEVQSPAVVAQEDTESKPEQKVNVAEDFFNLDKVLFSRR